MVVVVVVVGSITQLAVVVEGMWVMRPDPDGHLTPAPRQHYPQGGPLHPADSPQFSSVQWVLVMYVILLSRQGTTIISIF